jgi:hypothetical protein
LAFLSAENKAMFNVLKGWRFLTLTDNQLKISKAGRSFSYTYFDEPERLKQLVGYCRKFFQRDLQVKIVGETSPTRKSKGPILKEPAQSKPEDLSTPVQDILHMFQGEIVESRPAETGDAPKEVKK